MILSLTNFRAFAATGPLEIRPLTFLVGENSAGKTSFLAALNYIWQIRALRRLPSFNESPFDLGTFEEIVHRVPSSIPPDCFKLEIEDNVRPPRHISLSRKEKTDRKPKKAKLSLTFKSKTGHPILSILDLVYDETTLNINLSNKNITLKYKNDIIFDSSDNNSEFKEKFGHYHRFFEENSLSESDIFEFIPELRYILRMTGRRIYSQSQGIEENPEATKVARASVTISNTLDRLIETFPRKILASAPARSNPLRVYTSTDQRRSPEGSHTPQILFKISQSDKNKWKVIKEKLEKFGRESEMFSRINVNRYQKSGSSPFRISVTRKKIKSNIVDVGYGVSQALPILTDLILNSNKSGFLFQQPEVHLHPQAQAALGGFFVDYLKANRRSTIVAETHSDYMIDRVRICVQKEQIDPEKVLILYFDSKETETKIHSITIDKQGNLLNIPDDYRNFFVKEQMDLLGISQ